MQANLSVARGTIAVASWGDLAFFAGGQDEHKNNTDAFEIFNVTSRTMVVERLSQARSMASATTVGHYVLIAGGELVEGKGVCMRYCRYGVAWWWWRSC